MATLDHTYAQFDIMGFVDEIRAFGPVCRVMVRSTSRSKQAADLREIVFNEITVLTPAITDFINMSVRPGDFIHAKGDIRQTVYSDKRTGKRVYETQLRAHRFDQIVSTSESDESRSAKC